MQLANGKSPRTLVSLWCRKNRDEALRKIRHNEGIGTFDSCRFHFVSSPESIRCYRQQIGNRALNVPFRFAKISDSVDFKESLIKITQGRYNMSKNKLRIIDKKFDRDLGCLFIIQEDSN